MKKVVAINLGLFGSTGKIMQGILNEAEKDRYEVQCAYPLSENDLKYREDDLHICSYLNWKIARFIGQKTGYNGCFNYFDTLKLINKLKKIKPDILHIHNLHNCYINLPLLFKYIKKSKVKTVWTLHDCWAFTGQCPHFIYEKCDKWIEGCHDCKMPRGYPECDVDRSKTMWHLKKKWFSDVENLTIVTPSSWLATQVKISFLKQYPVVVINNGIDLSVFKPTESDFRGNNNIPKGAFVILGVSYVWGEKKGIDVFLQLADRLGDEYCFVLVGKYEDSSRAEIPKNVLFIDQVKDQSKLAEIYTASDIFLNPTREDTFPTVNIEALACGTPVVTFETGGSPEIIDSSCGISVEVNDIDGLEKKLRKIRAFGGFNREDCIRRAEQFNQHEKFSEYIKLFWD